MPLSRWRPCKCRSSLFCPAYVKLPRFRWLLNLSKTTAATTPYLKTTNTDTAPTIASLGLLRATIPPRLPPRARAHHAVLLHQLLSQLGAVTTRRLGLILSHHGPQAADQATVQRPARLGRTQALQWGRHPRKRCHCRLHLQGPQPPRRQRPITDQIQHRGGRLNRSLYIYEEL